MYIGLEKGQKAYKPNENSSYIVGLDSTVVNIENFGKTGRESKLVFNTAMTKLLAEVNGDEGMKDLRVVAQVVAAAYYEKNLSRDEMGQLRGYDLVLGIGSATTWNDRGTGENTKNENFYGTINILGATAHANIHYNGFNIKADFGFYGDFAMVKSYALNKYDQENPGASKNMATTVSNKGYYWGMGTTSLAAISVSKGRWEVGYSGQYSNAVSINGRHRLQEQITNKDTFSDTFSSSKIFITYQLSKNTKFRLTREYNFRSGEIAGSYKTEGVETRTMGTLIYQF